MYDILNACKTGMGEVISIAIYSTAARLGYASLKPCQENAVKAFISGRGIFISLPRDTENLLLLLSSLDI